MLSLYPLPLADRNLVVGQNPWKKSNVDRVICRDQTHKKVELVLAENGNSSIFFQGNPVEHNFPKKIRNIEKAKIFLQNVWVQSIVNSAGETRISFNPTLLGGGVLDNLPPKKLQEIKDRCQKALKDPTTDILGELLADDLIDFSDMEAYTEALTELYKSARKKSDPMENEDKEDAVEDGGFNQRDQNYAVAIIEQDVVQHLPPRLQPMAQKKLQQKASQALVVQPGSDQRSHTALSTVLERVEENSYYVQSANQQQQSSVVVLQQFSSQVGDLRELQGQRLKQSEGLTNNILHSIRSQASLRHQLVEGAGARDSSVESILARSQATVVLAKNERAVLREQFEMMNDASVEQAKALTVTVDAMAHFNKVVLEQYDQNARVVLERTCAQVSEHREAELGVFMKEQSGRQKVKEEEYRIDLAKRAKLGELDKEEKEFFLQMKAKESTIVLDEKAKANEIDLNHQLKMNKQEQARMEKEIAYLKEKDGDIEQRNLMTEFSLQLKIYEEDVKQCREEVQRCAGKKNYHLTLKPPEIKTGPDGKKFVQPGQTSYRIS